MAPVPGMQVWDETAGQTVFYAGGLWARAATPAAPVGGAVVDNEARMAIVILIASLRAAGIFSGD